MSACGFSSRWPSDWRPRDGSWPGGAEPRGSRPGVRLVPRDHLHVTLAFLGGRPAGRSSSDLREALCTRPDGARSAPVLEPGALPGDRARRRCSCSTTRGAGGIVQAGLSARLERVGVVSAREARPWLAHVTVARFRDRAAGAPALPDLGLVQSVRSRSLSFRSAAGRGAVRDPRRGCARRLNVDRDASTGCRAGPDRAAVRQGVGHEDERPGAGRDSRRSRPAASRSTWRSGSAGCRAAGSSRSSGRNRRARRPSSTT